MDNDTIKHSYTNDLIKETSPYLLQHAHNPVNWHAWGEEALNKAKMENKMILISIGYSACHWCHVMEKESFEDEQVAAYMNEHFICIKVDREERPDVDQVYMEAVQLITGRGGWPLNCFALPDGRPFYGGTYFPKKNWLYLLQNVVKEYESDRAKVESYANDLTANINRVHLAPEDTQKLEEIRILESTISQWRQNFDNKEGGPNRAPKFPLPNNYQFLMDYAIITHDEELLDHVELTLNKMALGGIYDQAGGGFARYSTDGIWKVPHFEKMLY
ncbi:MAG TPA: thioredoxin domain-containing protein, partial [Flavobacteriales bacterium]|nr:thioredoxin domain-containing protein [Flavobacteriales bacterium]